MRIHLTGASGTGTSTLGRALAARYGCPRHDTDDFFWLPTDPPYQRSREREERRRLLGAALARSRGWVLSGSLDGWGDIFIPQFDLVVFMSTPTEVRLARLRAREAARFGAAIAPGGAQHEEHEAFLRWAADYDTGGPDMRSRGRHEAWLAGLPCPVLRLDGRTPVGDLVARVTAALG